MSFITEEKEITYNYTFNLFGLHFSTKTDEKLKKTKKAVKDKIIELTREIRFSDSGESIEFFEVSDKDGFVRYCGEVSLDQKLSKILDKLQKGSRADMGNFKREIITFISKHNYTGKYELR
jgi:hypothetical protein